MLPRSTEKTIDANATTGIDEAGRGPLAGPVVSAAVTWPSGLDLHPLIKDSKKLSAKKREEAFKFIIDHAIDISYFAAGAAYVDKVNIRQATLQSMTQAYHLLLVRGDKIYVDGNDLPPALSSLNAQAVIKGDSLHGAVSSASIVAKIIRDRIMTYYHFVYPQYHFIAHKGYGTKAHYQALANIGPCPIHRRSFHLAHE